MAFWTNLWNNFNKNSKQYIAHFLPDSRIDEEYDSSPITPGEAYCRLWLVEMRLSKSMVWLTSRHPVVHSSITFDYQGQPRTIPYLAGRDYFKELTDQNLDKVIQRNDPLTPRFPYNRGDVRIQAGLLSLKGDDPTARFIRTMGRFSELLPVPELSKVLNLAGPVYSGIEDLLGAGESNLELGYQETFTSGGSGQNHLRKGYIAAILAGENQIDPNMLCVVGDSLRLGVPGERSDFRSQSQPLNGYSYMLFRLDRYHDQDWESLTAIKELVQKAQTTAASGKYEQVKELLPAIKVAVYQSDDLTKQDRRRVWLKIQDDLNELGLESTSGRVPNRTLNAIMKRPLPSLSLEATAELETFERFFDE